MGSPLSRLQQLFSARKEQEKAVEELTKALGKAQRKLRTINEKIESCITDTSSINPEDKRNLEITTLALRGLSVREIASQFHIHPGTVSRIINREMPRLRQAQQHIEARTGYDLPPDEIPDHPPNHDDFDG